MSGTPRPRTGDEPGPGSDLAERVRALLERAGAGALATLSLRHPGHPFASLVPFALDARARPLFLLSGLALHTRHLRADPRASLLVGDPDQPADAQAAARATLVGEVRALDGPEAEAARAAYLARHPAAGAWAGLADFAVYRLEPREVYLVAGFGVMGWVAPDAVAAARARASGARPGGTPPAPRPSS
jgi:putative heme iron utilization protein